MLLIIARIKIIGVVFLLSPVWLCGQDVEQQYQSLRKRIQNDPLKVTGNINATAQYYQAFGITGRAIPFNGRILAALNFDLLGVKMPFSLAYSNGGVVFNRRLPSYSFVGLSPSYKWAKLLVGTRTMNFGKYSFNNHSFNGGGIELTPGNWFFSGFYGRLRRARLEDFQTINNVDPYFKRMGFGGKIGYKNGKDKVLISIFKAWDDGSSVPSVALDSSLNFSPSENVILSGEIGKSIGPRMDLEINYSSSGFTDDRNLNAEQKRVRVSNYGGLLRKNISSRINNAFEAKWIYRFNLFSVNVGYERIDPGYRTMGALFFNNDLENISGGLNLKLFKSRLILIGRSGIQRNNLGEDQANQYRRIVGSANATIRATKSLTFTGSYSNFNHVNRRISIRNIDSLNVITDLVLSNENGSAGFSWILTNDNSRSSGIQGQMTFNRGATIENDLARLDQSSRTLTSTVNYFLQLKPAAWSFNGHLAHQRNKIGLLETTFNSVGISSEKSLLDNSLNISLALNYALSSQKVDDLLQASGRVINLQFSTGYQLTKTSAIVFTSGLINNHVENTNSGLQKFSEFRNTLNYTYLFNPQK
ncbi:TonB-dependent receptor [Portibacter marinus]|uniref:hypothetical protein n=1 Tax=Portibacter marinus TaxID=2898660 RepID=UPI001F3A35AA|nr:hypothetical protein [Portibacter marinus]